MLYELDNLLSLPICLDWALGPDPPRHLNPRSHFQQCFSKLINSTKPLALAVAKPYCGTGDVLCHKGGPYFV